MGEQGTQRETLTGAVALKGASGEVMAGAGEEERITSDGAVSVPVALPAAVTGLSPMKGP